MELFQQAATIMVLGMGLVFVFLAVVILCVQGAARLVQRHEARAAADDVVGSGDDGGMVAAIAVALHEHR
jgi:oxaloacetate decarboxylase gamma subunit